MLAIIQFRILSSRLLYLKMYFFFLLFCMDVELDHALKEGQAVKYI